jgi:hypothetical protein
LHEENEILKPENPKFIDNLKEINILKGNVSLMEDEIEWLLQFEKDKEHWNSELDAIRNRPSCDDNRAFSLKSYTRHHDNT